MYHTGTDFVPLRARQGARTRPYFRRGRRFAPSQTALGAGSISWRAYLADATRTRGRSHAASASLHPGRTRKDTWHQRKIRTSTSPPLNKRQRLLEKGRGSGRVAATSQHADSSPARSRRSSLGRGGPHRRQWTEPRWADVVVHTTGIRPSPTRPFEVRTVQSQ